MKKAITLTALVISVTINLWLWHKKNTLSLELASEQAHTLQIEQSLSDEYAHEKAIASAQAIANAKINNLADGMLEKEKVFTVQAEALSVRAGSGIAFNLMKDNPGKYKSSKEIMDESWQEYKKLQAETTP